MIAESNAYEEDAKTERQIALSTAFISSHHIASNVRKGMFLTFGTLILDDVIIRMEATFHKKFIIRDLK
jgi:hypothetical protein